jgi:hypothetical protein
MTSSAVKTIGDLIATITDSAPKGCYHIKIHAGDIVGHITHVQFGDWLGFHSENKATGEQLPLVWDSFSALPAEQLTRVDYLVSPRFAGLL